MIYPFDEDAGSSVGILFSGMRKYGDWRYEEAGDGWCPDAFVLPGYDGACHHSST